MRSQHHKRAPGRMEPADPRGARPAKSVATKVVGSVRLQAVCAPSNFANHRLRKIHAQIRKVRAKEKTGRALKAHARPMKIVAQFPTIALAVIADLWGNGKACLNARGLACAAWWIRAKTA